VPHRGSWWGPDRSRQPDKGLQELETAEEHNGRKGIKKQGLD